MQIEIQDYHRNELEKNGISLPPREETVLTISGNFTQKQLDKAAKKGKNNNTSEATRAPDAILTQPEALAIAQKFGFPHDGVKLRDWARASFLSASDETKQSNRQKLADVGLVPVRNGKGFAWIKL